MSAHRLSEEQATDTVAKIAAALSLPGLRMYMLQEEIERTGRQFKWSELHYPESSVSSMMVEAGVSPDDDAIALIGEMLRPNVIGGRGTARQLGEFLEEFLIPYGNHAMIVDPTVRWVIVVNESGGVTFRELEVGPD